MFSTYFNGNVATKTRLLVVAVGLVSMVAGVDSAVASPKSAKPYSLLAQAGTQAAQTVAETGEVEVGIKFRSSHAGSIEAIRFLKAEGDLDSHRVNLWSESGTLVATASSSSESANGWQTVYLPRPASVKAHRTYVVSYRTTKYMVSQKYFNEAVRAGPLTIPVRENGVFAGGASYFPSKNMQSTNYWVDPVFVAND